MGEGGLIWRWRLWLALKIMPWRVSRLIRRGMDHLPYETLHLYYWSNDRLAIDIDSDASRRKREIEAALPRRHRR